MNKPNEDEALRELDPDALGAALDSLFDKPLASQQSAVRYAASAGRASALEARKLVRMNEMSQLMALDSPPAPIVIHARVPLDLLIRMKEQATRVEGEGRKLREALTILIAGAMAAGGNAQSDTPESDDDVEQAEQVREMTPNEVDLALGLGRRTPSAASDDSRLVRAIVPESADLTPRRNASPFPPPDPDLGPLGHL